MKHSAFLLLIIVCACTNSNKAKESPPMRFVGKIFPSPSGEMASLPHLIKGGDNMLYLSWVEKSDSNWVYFKYSKLSDGEWTDPELISKGNDWFVNWADYPMIAADMNGNLMAHYLAKSSSGTYSYDVNVVIKPATEQYWSPPIIPHKDGTPTEHGFVTILPQDDNTFLLSWLDGRNTGGGEHNQEGHGNGGAMTIRTAVLDMNSKLTNQQELDNRVCDCCQTGGVMTASGPVIVYRDRSMEEVRDMSFVKRVNSQWTVPKSIARDNWNIAGCPVNGPRVAAINDQFAAAWFTASNKMPAVKVAFSNGEAFNEPITIDNQMPIGRVDIVMMNEQSALVSWMKTKEDKTVINFRKVNKDGSMGMVQTVAETNGSRGSGFPQMEKVGDQIYFAWTNLEEKSSTVKMKKFNLN